MNPVDERIRAAINALANQIPVTPPRLDDEFRQGPPRRHRYVRAAMLSFAAVAAAVLFFVSNTGREQSVRTVDQGGASCPGDQAGDIYLAAGASTTSAALFRGSLCPLRFRAVPGVPRVRGVSGAGGVVVVTSEGGQIQIGTGGAPPVKTGAFTDDRFVGDAGVSPEGLIAYTTTRPVVGDAVTDRLHAYDPKTGDTRPILADNRFLSRPAWGPGGRLAVVREALRQHEVPEVTIVEPDGTARHFALSPPPLMGNVWNVAWGTSNLVAVSYDILDPNPVLVTVLLNPDTGKQRMIRGYHALAWSPDGTTLLAQGETELALLHEPDFSPRTLGRPPSGVLGAAWLECAPSTCAASDEQRDEPVAATNRLGFAEFQRLAQDGALVSCDYFPRRSEVKGQYLADDGRQHPYTVRVPSATSREDLLEELLGYGVPMTVHD